MSNYKRILSGDDVLTLAERHFSFDVEVYCKEVYSFAERLEQTVLAKLTRQEPVAWTAKAMLDDHHLNAELGIKAFCSKEVLLDEYSEAEPMPLYAHPLPADQHTPVAWLNEETGDVISSELKDDAPEMLKGYDTPLYKCPVPSSQVNLDSSNHIADMRKMDVQDGWQLVPKTPTHNMVDNAHNCDSYFEVQDIYKAMLAAAPKYKWGVRND